MLAAGRDGLWLVTRGAQTEAAAMDAADGACIAGLGKVAALEHSELRCRPIDLDPDAADPVAALFREVLPDDGDNEICWRGGPHLAARLAPPTCPGSRKSVG